MVITFFVFSIDRIGLELVKGRVEIIYNSVVVRIAQAVLIHRHTSAQVVHEHLAVGSVERIGLADTRGKPDISISNINRQKYLAGIGDLQIYSVWRNRE